MEVTLEQYHDYCMEHMKGSELEPTESTPEEDLVEYVQALLHDLSVVNQFNNALTTAPKDHQIWEDIEFMAGELYRITGWLTK